MSFFLFTWQIINVSDINKPEEEMQNSFVFLRTSDLYNGKQRFVMSKNPEKILLDASQSAAVSWGEKWTIIVMESFVITVKYFKAGFEIFLGS
jgi:hypothetical protein